MSDDKKPPAPTAPPIKAEPRLVSIAFPAPLTLINMSPVNGIVIGDKLPAWPAENVSVTSNTVYLRPPGSERIIEIQRAACVLHWISEMPLEEAVAAIRKVGR